MNHKFIGLQLEETYRQQRSQSNYTGSHIEHLSLPQRYPAITVAAAAIRPIKLAGAQSVALRPLELLPAISLLNDRYPERSRRNIREVNQR
jgi:hypothetical protein